MLRESVDDEFRVGGDFGVDDLTVGWEHFLDLCW